MSERGSRSKEENPLPNQEEGNVLQFSEQTSTNPETDDSASTNPETDDSAPTNPVTDDSASINPETNDSAPTNPVTDDSAPTNPETDDSASINPETDDSASINPETDDSASINPETDDSASINPETDDSAPTNPVTDDSANPKTYVWIDPVRTDEIPRNRGAEDERNPLPDDVLNIVSAQNLTDQFDGKRGSSQKRRSNPRQSPQNKKQVMDQAYSKTTPPRPANVPTRHSDNSPNSSSNVNRNKTVESDNKVESKEKSKNMLYNKSNKESSISSQPYTNTSRDNAPEKEEKSFKIWGYNVSVPSWPKGKPKPKFKSLTQRTKDHSATRSCVIVTFHTVISDSKSQQIYISISPDGVKWDSWDVALIKQSNTIKGLHHLSGSCYMEQELLKQGLRYRYIIRHDETFEWEQSSSQDVTRHLIRDEANQEVVEQFDLIHVSKHDVEHEAFLTLAEIFIKFDSFEDIFSNIEHIMKLYQFHGQKSEWIKRLIDSQMNSIRKPNQPINSLLTFKKYMMVLLLKTNLGLNIEKEFLTQFFNVMKRVVAQCSQYPDTYCKMLPTSKLFILDSIGSVMDQYLDLLQTDRSLPVYSWIFGYVFIILIRDEDDEKLYFDINKWFTKCQNISDRSNEVQDILELIKNIGESNSVLKNKLIEVCSFKDLVKLFKLKEIRNFCLNTVLKRIFAAISHNDESLQSLFTEFREFVSTNCSTLQKLDFDQLSTLIENVSSCPSEKCFFHVFTILNDLHPIDKERINQMLSSVFAKYIQILNSFDKNDWKQSIKHWSHLFQQFPCFQFHPDVTQEMESQFRAQRIDAVTPQHLNQLVHRKVLESVFTHMMQQKKETNFIRVVSSNPIETPQFIDNIICLAKLILRQFPDLDKSSECFCESFLQTIKRIDNIEEMLNLLSRLSKNNKSKVSVEIQNDFLNFMEALDTFQVLLYSREISLKEINLLADPLNRDRILQFHEIRDRFGIHENQRNTEIIQERLSEYKEFVDLVYSFVEYFTQNFDLHLSDFHEDILISSRIKLKDVTLNEQMTEQSEITREFDWLPLSPHTANIMSKFQVYKDSEIFRRFFENHFQQAENKVIAMSEIIGICDEMEIKFQTLSQSIIKEMITVKELRDLFSGYDTQSVNKELTLVSQMNKTEEATNQSSEKIQFCVKLFERKVILDELLETYKIIHVGDAHKKVLETLMKIIESDENVINEPITVISADMLHYEEILQICETQLEALIALNKSTDIINWLLSFLKDIQGLKFFEDLARSSLAENDTNKDKIDIFPKAIRGYSSLLFELQPNCSVFQLTEVFRHFNASLTENPKAPTQLIESNRFTKWFGLVKDRHTSLERSSLADLKRIVERGNLEITLDKSQKQHTLSVSIEEENDTAGAKEIWQGSNLEELESKLMLMKFESEYHEWRDRFVLVMQKSKVIQSCLSSILEKGCSLFQQFSVRCVFSESKKVSVYVDFGFKTDIIKGKGELFDEMDSIISFLNNSQKQWNNYLSELRNKFPLLNYYTNVQLDTLSHSCSDILYQREVDMRESYSLFRLISKLITKESVNQAVSSFILENENKMENDECNVQHQDDNDQVQGHNLSTEPTNDNSELLQSVRSFVDTILEEYSAPEANVIAAIIETDELEDADRVAEWCMENSDKKATWQDLTKHFVKSNDFPSNQSKTIIESGETLDQLKSEMNLRWVDFLNRSNTAQKCESISFECLNSVIQNLHEEYHVVLDRMLPTELKPGAPNLVTISKSDIYKTLLTIYAHDKTKPLPGLDEVLICEKDSPLEQVVLHCERAFADTSGKIYSIAFAERISLENCIQIEKLFRKPAQNKHYRLVFLVSKEKGRHSRISDILMKYRVNKSMDINNGELSEYLHNQLKTNLEETNQNEPHLNEYSFRVIRSDRFGEGKSTLSQTMSQQLQIPRIVMSIHSNNVDYIHLISSLYSKYEAEDSGMFHINLTSNSKTKHLSLIFSLSVISGIRDPMGHIWIKSPKDFITTEFVLPDSDQKEFTDYLPTIWCKSPIQSLTFYKNNSSADTKTVLQMDQNKVCHFMDHSEYESEVFQRSAQYLQQLRRNDVDKFTYQKKNQLGTQDCIEEILKGIKNILQDPTWVETGVFCKFLNEQLQFSEKSVFCNTSFVGDTLPGFRSFVVKFLIQMSKDFTVHSATISDESLNAVKIEEKRRWECNPHPYLFFNGDGHTITFLGFKVQNLNLLDDRGTVIERQIMRRNLFEGLKQNGIDFSRDQSKMTQPDLRQFYLEELCKVFGIPKTETTGKFDSDYELTSDNVMKMLAIHVRWKANIPILIIGETGVGKTRLIQFICSLMKQNQSTKNLKIIKCHGGTTCEDVYLSVNEVIDCRNENSEQGTKSEPFVIFFDEANTTEAVGAIKEIMCDGLVNGAPIPKNLNLKFIAAINPYRKHSEEMIEKLESAGLGYHVEAKKTKDKLGRIPMRHLVYRVKETPPSFLPLIWDFGRLSNDAQKKYIDQIVQAYITERNFTDADSWKTLFVSVLNECQNIMQEREDECSYVSLRDVERCLKVHDWLTRKSIWNGCKKSKLSESYQRSPILIDFILSISFTYYFRLENRQHFFESLLPKFQNIGSEITDCEYFTNVITECQNVFLNEIRIDKDISRNEALRENVWMMVICFEMKIPLFLIGKPGTSKSLAKTVVNDVMQGTYSYSELFKKFKEIHMISFQCSQLSTSESIQATFKMAQDNQERRKENLDKFSSVVVLDEIGLAEDSPNMPLKVLHPLLECTKQDEEFDEINQVAFVGISNWALDPAKMNRGVFISRGNISREDLILTVEGISQEHIDSECHSHVGCQIIDYLENLVDGYLSVARAQTREYYGLRELYSLIKMLISECEVSKGLSPLTIRDCIYRCFGGAYEDFNPAEIVMANIRSLKKIVQQDSDHKLKMIRKALNQKSNNRYLLFLTKNNMAFHALIENDLCELKAIALFGSSFPLDKDYVTVCKSINQIKIGMETGKTLILCNLSHIYESLYDVLNQSYVRLGDDYKYADLGLGTHRVKCRVHDDFRIIIVAEDEEVFNNFPPPLLNRLEKHYLDAYSLLDSEKKTKADEIETWVIRYSEINSAKDFAPQNVFIGYYEDVAAMVIQKGTNDLHDVSLDTISHRAKQLLMNCATPDSILRLSKTKLSQREIDEVFDIRASQSYLRSLTDLLCSTMERCSQSLIQVTTYCHVDHVEQFIENSNWVVETLLLDAMQTEQEFRRRLKQFFNNCSTESQSVLIIQWVYYPQFTEKNFLKSVRFCINDVSKEFENRFFSISLVIQIPKTSGTSLVRILSSSWMYYHLDEIKRIPFHFDYLSMKGSTLSSVLENLKEEFVQNLLIESLLESCSKTTETKKSPRIFKRIEILTESLKNDAEFSLTNAVRKIIVDKYREEDTNDWITKISTESLHLLEGYTFQSSIWMGLINQIEKYFPEIIQISDVNMGLDHLELSADPSKRKLFLDTLDSFIKIDNNWIGKMVHETQEICSGIPFSWLFQRHCNEIYSGNEDSEMLQTAFLKTGHGQILNKYFEENQESAVISYSTDCLLLNWPVFQRFPKLISRLASEIKLSADRTRKPVHNLSSTDIFLAVKCLQHKLNILSEVIQLCTDVFQISTVKTNLESFMIKHISDERSIDESALKMLFDLLDPKNFNLIDRDVRIKWIEAVLHSQIYLEKCHSISFQLSADLRESKRNLERMSLFINHVIFDANSNVCMDEIFKKAINNMRLRMKKIKDLKSGEDCKCLLQILHDVSVIAGNLLFFNNKEVCYICEEKYTDPVCPPCRHVACRLCLTKQISGRTQDDGSWNCPQKGCNKTYSTPQITNATENRDVKHEFERFKSKLGLFFLENLGLYSFSGDSLPEKGLMDTLLTNFFDKDSNRNGDGGTKISDFQENYLDEKSIMKSNILQMMFRCNWKETISYLNIFYQENIQCLENDKKFLLIVLHAMENTFAGKASICDDSKQSQDYYIILFQSITQNEEIVSVFEHLDFVVKMKACLRYAAFLIYQTVTIGITVGEKQTFLMNMESFIERLKIEYPCKFICSEICESFGVKYLQEWRKLDVYPALIPQLLREFVYQPDYFNVSGETYRLERDKIIRDLTNKLPLNQMSQTKTCSDANFCLSLFFIYNSGNFNKNIKENSELLMKSMRNQQTQNSCLINWLNKLCDQETSSIQETTIWNILFHLLTVLVNSEDADSSIPLFYKLCFTPQELSGRYFPTMPQDTLSDIMEGIYDPGGPGKAHWKEINHIRKFYKCPNGHIYGVGNCGNFEDGTGYCPDCPPGTIIGKGQAGAKPIESFEDTTQPGYILGPADESRVIGVRSINSTSVITIRFLMHGAMYLSGNKEELVKLMNPAVDLPELDNFLMKHLISNFNQLGKCLERSEDQTECFLHSVIQNLLIRNGGANSELSNKKERQEWEESFANNLIKSDTIDNDYNKFRQSVIEDERNQADYLITTSHLPNPEDSDCKLPFLPELWCPVSQMNIPLLFRKYSLDDLKVKCPLLTYLHENRSILEHTKQLTEIIQLQIFLIEKFNYNLDINDLETLSLQDLLKGIEDIDQCDDIENKVKRYLNLFHLMKDSIASHSSAGYLAASQFKHQIREDCLNTPCGIIFPSRKGLGLCAISCVEYLIDQNNTAVHRYFERNGINSRSYLSPESVSEEQLVVYNEEFLETLLLLHSDSDIDSDNEIDWRVDLEELERHVGNRFFAGRRLLDKTKAPRFFLSHEKVQSFKLSTKISQSPLTGSIQGLLESRLTTIPYVCLFLKHCLTIKRLLIATWSAGMKINGSTSLSEYIQMINYKLPDSLSGIAPTDDVTLEQVDDLILFLNVVRAKRMILYHQDPWTALLKPEAQMRIESEDLKRSLDSLLTSATANRLLTILFGFIEDFISTDMVISSSPLSQNLYVYLTDHLECEDEDIFFEMSEEILVRHSTDCFEYLVEKSNELDSSL